MTDTTLQALLHDLREKIGASGATAIALDVHQHVFPADDSSTRLCTECDREWYSCQHDPCVVRIVGDVVSDRAHDQFVWGSLTITDYSGAPLIGHRFKVNITTERNGYEREAIVHPNAQAVLDVLALHGWTFRAGNDSRTDKLAPLRALACLQGIGERERMSLGADAWAATPGGASELLHLLAHLAEGAIAIDTDDPRIVLATRLLRDAAALHDTEPIGSDRMVPVSDERANQLLSLYRGFTRRPLTP